MVLETNAVATTTNRMIDNYDPICEFIRMKRIEKGISQVELAKLSFVSERSIQLIEAGNKVRNSTLDKVLKVFGKQLVVSYSFEELKK